MNVRKLKQIEDDSKMINYYLSGTIDKNYIIEVDAKMFEIDSLRLILEDLYNKYKIRNQWQAVKSNDKIFISVVDINKDLKENKIK